MSQVCRGKFDDITLPVIPEPLELQHIDAREYFQVSMRP